ncbi:outer membrane beta-barrel protein [Hymenobacter sp. HMF4947]|uniref:Outer membrane beta-barrel protein n=1 Tax=Hymenobacter ginkgonis TaxID=2682976 RepID=A0A7K1TI23_9BACT|nr:porin family protein [Hymenobacter ginkgonis]MVN78002.1 outer membrane beta-barrel protein [Hymenobacter ginkgonis]
MKKLFLTLAALAVAPAAFAQVEIGLKVSPSITYLRPDSPSSTSFTSEKAKLSFGGGIFVDYFFGENYAFNTGLFLTGKGGTIGYNDRTVSPSGGTTGVRVEQKISLQYLELPLTVKLFTNEVAPDTRVYFQVGGSLAVPVQARIDGEKYYTDPYDNNNQTKAGSHILDIDANLIGGAGVEYQLGQSTKLLAGISYHHGLVDFDRYFEKNRGFSDVNIKNSLFALDLGLKF